MLVNPEKASANVLTRPVELRESVSPNQWRLFLRYLGRLPEQMFTYYVGEPSNMVIGFQNWWASRKTIEHNLLDLSSEDSI